MNIVGIIVEYNPLHNGHVYHFNKIKELENPDLIIAVMSSSFTNRGELSLFDKFKKTEQALSLGVDIIIELPLIYTVERADIFANKAVNLLNQIGVNKIYIGSEENNIKLYEDAYNLIKENDDLIKTNLNKGLSYKESISKIINLKPNDMLGYSYFKAIKDLNLNIELKTIKRINSEYDDEIPTNSSITSAKSIRLNLDLIDKYSPNYVSKDKLNIINNNLIFDYLKYNILSKTTNELKNIFFFNDLDSFINYLTTKRYTKTRIKRLLIYVLLNIKKDDANIALNENILRILGFNEKGKNYLNSIKKNILYYTNIKEGLNKTLDIELKSSKIIDLIYNLNLFNKEQKGPIQKENDANQ